MDTRKVTLVATIAVIALVAVGIGYAYTAMTVNTGNTTDVIYLTITQGPNATDYSSSFDEYDVTYDTFKSDANLLTFFSGVSNEGVPMTPTYATIAGAVVTVPADQGAAKTAYDAAVSAKEKKYVSDVEAKELAAQKLRIAGVDPVGKTVEQVTAAIDALLVSDAEKARLNAAKDVYFTPIDAAALAALNATNAALYSLGSKTFTVSAQGLANVPIYDLRVKVVGLDFDHYRYFVSAKDASDATPTYIQLVQGTEDTTPGHTDLTALITTSAVGKTAPVFEFFVAEKFAATVTAENLVLNDADFTFQIENHTS